MSDTSRSSSGLQPSDSATFWMRVGREANHARKDARKGEKRMCMSCGCGEPHATHGDKRNIVNAGPKKAADASKISLKDAVRNIEKTLRTKNPRSPAGR